MASEISEYILWLVWSCLSLTPAALKNPVFAMIFNTEDMLEQCWLDFLLVLAPGLLDVLKAATPPTIAYFKTLSTVFEKRWGVYLLVLEKQGCRPKIYIGSGTNSVRGLVARMYCYTSGKVLHRFVKLALDDGYQIFHKGLLFWTPMPTAMMRIPVRVLIVAIEATFSIVLWAMKSRTKDYGMPHLCPWSL
jgi:hypothetical protein